MNEHHRIEVYPLKDGAVTAALVTERRLQESTVIQELAEELDALLEPGRPANILVNLSRVEFISSAALNRLITFHDRVQKSGGRLALTNLKPQIEEVFAITRLNKHFDIHADESAALASYP